MSFVSKVVKLLPILVIALASCSQQPKIQNDLLQKFYQLPSFKVGKSTRAVVFISDHNCSTCNQMFVDFLKKKVDDKNIVFVVSSGANKIDISTFLNATNENIVYDHNKALYYDDKLQTSMVFILNQDQVDTVLQINPQQVEDQLGYLNTVL
jgi:hypothetical protein